MTKKKVTKKKASKKVTKKTQTKSAGAAVLEVQPEKSNTQTPAGLQTAATDDSSGAKQLGMVLGGVEILLPPTIQERMQLAMTERNQSAIHAARAGYFLLSVKENTGHGEFLKELEKAKWPERDAQDCMAIASMLLKHGPEIQDRLTRMNKSNLIQLTRLEPETIKELAESEELDELASMTNRELAKEVRYLKQVGQDLTMKLQLEKQKGKELKKPHKWSEEVIRIREESNLYGNQVGYMADQFQILMSGLQSHDWQLDIARDNVKEEVRVASQTLYLNIVDSYRRLKRLVVEFHEADIPYFNVDRPDDLETLDDAELSKLRTLTQMMKRQNENDKKDRHVVRTNKAREGKRGRPVGSTKKS
jgi:ribosomal protein S6